MGEDEIPEVVSLSHSYFLEVMNEIPEFDEGDMDANERFIVIVLLEDLFEHERLAKYVSLSDPILASKSSSLPTPRSLESEKHKVINV